MKVRVEFKEHSNALAHVPGYYMLCEPGDIVMVELDRAARMAVYDMVTIENPTPESDAAVAAKRAERNREIAALSANEWARAERNAMNSDWMRGPTRLEAAQLLGYAMRGRKHDE